MKNEVLKFQIEQLRRDKVIYACESVAVNTACVVCILVSRFYLSDPVSIILSFGALVVGVGYTIYMGVGNNIRLRKIRQLERELDIRL